MQNTAKDAKLDFGTRMKLYEGFETERKFIPLLPIYARVDGRGFSKFTKGIDRPYDARMSRAMIETTKYLVKETHAKIGYCQSDEISLIWKAPDFKSDIFFDGKIHKMTSVLASMATAAFIRAILSPEIGLADYLPRMPHFDGRVLSFPNDIEATNMVLWRTADAVKNAISMAARAYYSHKELMHKSGPQMQEMLFQKGVNFNDYPRMFKQGTFVRRVGEMRKLTADEIKKIVDKYGYDEDRLFERFSVKEIDMPIFSKVTNRVDVIFNGADPFIQLPTFDRFMNAYMHQDWDIYGGDLEAVVKTFANDTLAGGSGLARDIRTFMIGHGSNIAENYYKLYPNSVDPNGWDMSVEQWLSHVATIAEAQAN